MANKKHATTRARKGNGKKRREQKLECGNGTVDHAKDMSDEELLVLRGSKDNIPRTKLSILLFFVSALIATGAAMYQRYTSQREAVGQTFPPSTLSSPSQPTTSLSNLFDVVCSSSTTPDDESNDNSHTYCYRRGLNIHDENRTITASRTIRAGQKLLQIPRTIQITTLDALRDSCVRKLLEQNPRHPATGKPLHPKAYLAVYMALEDTRLRTGDQQQPIKNAGTDRLSTEAIRRAYLEYLPKYDNFAAFHPVIAWNYTTLSRPEDTTGPASSLTEHMVHRWRSAFVSEYRALCRASSSSSNHSDDHKSIDFGSLVSLNDWFAARLVVNTRAFHRDPLTHEDVDDDELEYYRPFLQDDAKERSKKGDESLDHGKDSFRETCRDSLLRSCMVPLLDALDHHVKPNVQWQFSDNTAAAKASSSSHRKIKPPTSFLAFAARKIEPGAQLLDSYGSSRKSPDPILLAQYGFSNPDRSGGRAALLAPYHQIVDVDVEPISGGYDNHKDLQQYLAFQDGYERCFHEDNEQNITEEDASARAHRKAFQEAKFQALVSKSRELSSWMATIPPPKARRLLLHELLNESGDPEGEGIHNVLALCRLLATTHRDYGGKATKYLATIATADRPEQYQLRVSTHTSNENDLGSSAGLEFRTWHTMSRLADAMRSKVLRLLVELDSEFGHNAHAIGSDMDWEIEVDISRRLDSGALGLEGSPEWSRLWALIGELETLSILHDHAERQKKLLRDQPRTIKANASNADYFVRQKPCK